jgi:hypothetical protein
MVIQPQLDTEELEELQDDIEAFRDEWRKITFFEKADLQRKLDSLRSVISRLDYLLIQGRIFYLIRDVSSMKKTYMDAINTFPDNERAHFDYLASLINLAMYQDAALYGKIILEKFGENNPIARLVKLEITKAFLCLGKISQAHNFLQSLDDYENNKEHFIVPKILAIFEDAKLDDDSFKKIYDLFFSVLENKNVLRAITATIMDDKVFYKFYVELHIDEIVELNWEASCVLAENLDDMRCDVVMFEFEPVDIFKEQKEMLELEG